MASRRMQTIYEWNGHFMIETGFELETCSSCDFYTIAFPEGMFSWYVFISY